MKVNMNKYPLFFTYHDLIAGNGFVASIAINGSVLLSQEEDGYWMYGVQPGGIAGGGPDRNSALLEFKASYLSVMFDIAAEAQTFDAFKKEVEGFFQQINEQNREDWNTALADVRRRQTSLDGINRVNAESKKLSIQVSQADQTEPTPKLTQFGEVQEAA